MGFLQPVFWVVILLGIMILVHELGHFWAALAVGVKVETFSIGFGPRLFGFKRGETDFRVSAIPFGGYVRMLGEQPGQSVVLQAAELDRQDGAADAEAVDPRAFYAKARWQRAIVIIAGPLMNVILAIAIVAGLYMYAFPKEVETADPVITSIAPGSPAAQAGLQAGDKLIQIGNQRDPNWQDVMTLESLNANRALPVIVDRHGRRLSYSVTPKMDPKEGIGVAGWNGEEDVQIGQVLKNSPAEAAGLRPGDLLLSVNEQPVVSPVVLRQAVVQSAGKPVSIKLMRDSRVQTISVTPTATHDSKLPWHIGIEFSYRVQIVRLSIGPALAESLKFNSQNATMIFRVLGSIVERRVSPKALAGPIGIAQLSSEAAQQGPLSFLLLMSVVSLNLAIFNLLPIPILDGGTLLLLIIEMLLQREVSLQVKETVLKLGFVFLMMIVVFVIYNDISRIVTNG
ncbi:MAG TPA: RIP metalloprotease RseP [Bryobacteraceae bacterium]|nr:RIP metalloprotease RseP [Bryobacteraceae bacterium]